MSTGKSYFKRILGLRQGCEAPYRVIRILWINSKHPFNSGYAPYPCLSLSYYKGGLYGIQKDWIHENYPVAIFSNLSR